MSNKIYRDRIINQINYAVKESENAAQVEHPGLVGRIRELAASHIFGPSLPSGFEIGTGKICDRTGTQSGETDLIIYNKGILPPVMYSERDGVFPVEACFYSIEVKSKSTASTIQDAIQKGKQILQLDYENASADRPLNISVVVLTYFAFDSDLSDSGMSELQRYANYDPQWRETPILKAMCVVGKGYWYHDYNNKRWVFHHATPTHDEVVDLVAGTVNTLALARLHPRQAKLGHYLMLERPSMYITSL
jgi:hypothetical protein